MGNLKYREYAQFENIEKIMYYKQVTKKCVLT